MAAKAQRAQALADALTNRATPQAQVVQLVGTSATTELPSGSAGVNLGAGAANDVLFDGHLDEWRFTQGVARSTGAYTVDGVAFPDS